MHIKKPKGSSMISVIDSNVKHENHGHGHMGKNGGGVLHNNGMSLFQDLKLKRRKVDSRCSSDGESIGTSDSTASLSPDAQAQGNGSPKDKDRCHTPEEMGPNVRGSDMTNNGFPPDAFIFMIKAERERGGVKEPHVKVSSTPPPMKTNGVIKLTSNGITTNGMTNGTSGGNIVFLKSEPTDEDRNENGLSLNKSNREGIVIEKSSVVTGNGHIVVMSPMSSPQRPRKSPIGGRNSSSRPNSSAGSDNESTGSRSSCKSEKKLIVDEDMGNHSPPPLISRLRDPNSPPDQNSNSDSSSTSGVGLSPQSSMSGSSVTFTKHNNSGQQGQSQQRISPNFNRVPSPVHHPHSHLQIINSHHQLLGNQNHLHTRLTSGPHTTDPRNSLRIPSPMIQSELRNMTEKPDPLSVVTSTSLSFHHHSMYRINGVRPEIISGGAVTPTNHNSPGNSNGSQTGSPPSHHHGMNGGGSMRKSPNHPSRSPNGSPQSNSGSSVSSVVGNGSIHSPGSGSNTIVAGGSLGLPNSTTNGNSNGNNHHHVNLNRTPTVIMGEAGGVRTMLWSQNLPPELGISSSPSNGSPPSNGHYGIPPLANGTSLMTNGHNSPPQHNNSNNTHHTKGGLSMERLWASEALNLSTGPGSNPTNTANHTSYNIGSPQQNGHYQHHQIPNNSHHPEDDEYEQPMICMICEDRATGLHYGIITCEGCKGFFKRTVQNRRVYTCVADGTCEITKAQRNRCQYCRFKKCIEQGMVLQAVREDRMPGGRNSGAVYNLYKVPVKYRKHKKGNRGNGKGEKLNSSTNNILNCTNGNGNNGMTQPLGPPPPTQSNISGTILKAALTSPNEVNHLRQGIPFDQAAGMITHLVQCDNFHDIAALQNWEELLEGRGDLSEKLCQMGDSIVYRLVQWTKRLPFYQEVPVEVHTRVLTHKWHELLVLTTSAWQAMHTPGPPTSLTAEEETMENIQILQRCLQAMMGRSLTLEQLRQDVGQMVERLTYLTRSFRRLGIRIEEYVTLKVIAMLQNTGTKSNEVAVIQERYIKCLRTFLEVTCPSHPNRLNDLLRTLPEVQAAASLLLESKMFYVPFLLNSALLQR